MKLVKLMNKIPGGIMVIPLLAGVIINTFIPDALQIGGATTGLLKDGTNCLMGLFLICCGASISFKQVGAPLYKGALLTVLKVCDRSSDRLGCTNGIWTGRFPWTDTGCFDSGVDKFFRFNLCDTGGEIWRFYRRRRGLCFVGE